jgi:hypothetical protein
LTFVQSFHKEYNYVYEFTYELENGTTIAFYINCVFDNPEVYRVVEELKRFKKEIPFYNNYGFTFDPEEWFAKKFNYLNELMINRQLGHLATHIVVYYVLRLFIDEVDKGGILNFFDNSYKFLYDEINVCLDIINNSDINNIMNKAYEILDNYDYDNINLSDEDILKIEELDNEFYQYKDQFLNQIDSYYKQSYKKLTHSGELMIKELHEDNVYSKICEHLKPILTYELNNNNYITKIQGNKRKGEKDFYKMNPIKCEEIEKFNLSYFALLGVIKQNITSEDFKGYCYLRYRLHKNLNLVQEQIADELGLDQSTISKHILNLKNEKYLEVKEIDYRVNPLGVNVYKVNL